MTMVNPAALLRSEGHRGPTAQRVVEYLAANMHRRVPTDEIVTKVLHRDITSEARRVAWAHVGRARKMLRPPWRLKCDRGHGFYLTRGDDGQ